MCPYAFQQSELSAWEISNDSLCWQADDHSLLMLMRLPVFDNRKDPLHSSWFPNDNNLHSNVHESMNTLLKDWLLHPVGNYQKDGTEHWPLWEYVECAEVWLCCCHSPFISLYFMWVPVTSEWPTQIQRPQICLPAGMYIHTERSLLHYQVCYHHTEESLVTINIGAQYTVSMHAHTHCGANQGYHLLFFLHSGNSPLHLQSDLAISFEAFLFFSFQLVREIFLGSQSSCICCTRSNHLVCIHLLLH